MPGGLVHSFQIQRKNVNDILIFSFWKISKNKLLRSVILQQMLKKSFVEALKPILCYYLWVQGFIGFTAVKSFQT